MATDGLIRLRFGHRDLSVITKVELEAAGEARFYEALKRPSPTDMRHNLASIFRQAMALPVTDCYRDGWELMCANMAAAAESGGSVAPFCRGDAQGTEELLRASSQLLCWKTESLLRFASCQIFGRSKRLGELRGTIEAIVALVTDGKIKCLSELGILDNPRSCLISGPAILHFPEGVVDLRALRAPLTISIADIARCLRVETPALRFCTIENPTTFHELAKLGDATLLACSDGYAGSALFAFMEKLPPIMKYHFGDSDPAGFDILADIRKRSGSQIESLHMAYRPGEKPEPVSTKDRSIAERVMASKYVTEDEKLQVQRIVKSDDKGIFEQEMLGIPVLLEWPFYPCRPV